MAEFEYFPVFFPDNRELWEKVFSGQALVYSRVRIFRDAWSSIRYQGMIRE